MAQKIRLSPSGPVLGDAGPNFQLRLAASDAALTSQPVTTVLSPLTGNLAPAEVMLSAPDPTKLYGVKGHFLMNTIGNAGTSYTALIELSYDGLAWFSNPAANAGTVNTTPRSVAPPVVDNQTQINVFLAPTLGSALWTPMVGGETEIWARISVRAAAITQFSIPDQGVGLYGLELTEYTT